MFFSSIKEINRLLIKGMSNVIDVTIDKEVYSKLRFSKFKKFVSRSIFGELQLMQISSNFQISCCNLKIRGLRAKLCVAFLLFFILKGVMTF